MPVEAAGRPGDRSDLEVADRMIDNLQIGFKVRIADLLEENVEFSFDLLGEMEEVELILLVLRKERVDQLLELLWTCCGWEFVHSQGFVAIVDEVDEYVLRDLYDGLGVGFHFLAGLHFNNVHFIIISIRILTLNHQSKEDFFASS